MAKTEKVIVEIEVKSKGADQATNKITDSQKKLKTSVDKSTTAVEKQGNKLGGMKSVSAGAVAAYAAIAAALAKLVAMTKESIDLFVEQEKQNFRVGKVFGEYADEINDAANATQAMTTIGNEAYQSFAVAAKAYGVANEQVNDVVQNAIGLAEKFDRLKPERVIQMLALAEQGDWVMFERYIPALEGVTDKTEALMLINEAAAEGFAQASEYADTYGGKMIQIDNAIGDVKEIIGQGIMEGAWDTEDGDKMLDLINELAAALEKTGFISGTLKIAKDHIEALYKPMVDLTKTFMDLGKAFGMVDEETTDLEGALNALTFVFEKGMAAVQAFYTPLRATAKGIQGFITVIMTLVEEFDNLWTAVKTLDFKWLWEQITDLRKEFINLGKTMIKDTLEPLTNLLGVTDKFSDALGVEKDALSLTADELKRYNDLLFDHQAILEAVKNEVYLNEIEERNQMILDNEEEMQLYMANKQKEADAESEATYKKLIAKKKKIDEDYAKWYKKQAIELQEELLAEIDALTIDRDKSPIAELLSFDEEDLEEEETAILDYALTLGQKFQKSFNIAAAAGGSIADKSTSFIASLFQVSDDDAAAIASNLTQVAAVGFDAVNQIRKERFAAEQQEELDIHSSHQERLIELADGDEKKIAAIKRRGAEAEEKLLKRQAKERQEMAIREALMQGAMSIISIMAQSPDPLKPLGPLVLTQFALAAATTAAQVAVIKSQKMAQGGLIEGASHSNGGVIRELEGGEGVINKNSMGMPGMRNLVSSINQVGGGVAFPQTQSSGALTASISESTIAAIVAGVASIPVNVVETDMTNTQRKVNVIETKAQF